MYPNNKQQSPYDFSKTPEEMYTNRDPENSQFPVQRNNPNFASYPSFYPPHMMPQPQYNFEVPQSYMYPAYQQMGQTSRVPLNMYPQPQVNQINPADTTNSDILRGIAMLGRLFDLNGEEKVKSSSPERKKKIVKDEREIRLGNIIFRPSKGDWQCKERACSNWNYAKRDRCNKCNRHKDRVDRVEVKPEKKVIRKFWNCPECNFQNYEYKEKCYKCGLKKPEGDRGSDKNDR